MNSSFSDSVVLITSRAAPDKSNFGTGFVIAQDQQSSYVLTCAHVVRDVGGVEQVMAEGLSAAVISLGEAKGVDLAVLRVEGLLDKPPLKLCAVGKKERSFVIPGFYEYASKTRVLREIQGQLGNLIQLALRDNRERIPCWDLSIQDTHYLQPGYSGSPVVETTNGCVLGVVSHRSKGGEEGLVISIKALELVWLEMPAHLISSSCPSLEIRDFSEEEIRQNLEEILQEIQHKKYLINLKKTRKLNLEKTIEQCRDINPMAANVHQTELDKTETEISQLKEAIYGLEQRIEQN